MTDTDRLNRLMDQHLPGHPYVKSALHDFNDHLNAWRLGAGQGVKVKPNRLVGLTRARQVQEIGVAAGWQMHIEDVGGTVLADTAAIHLAFDRARLSFEREPLSHSGSGS